MIWLESFLMKPAINQTMFASTRSMLPAGDCVILVERGSQRMTSQECGLKNDRDIHVREPTL